MDDIMINDDMMQRWNLFSKSFWNRDWTINHKPQKWFTTNQISSTIVTKLWTSKQQKSSLKYSFYFFMVYIYVYFMVYGLWFKVYLKRFRKIDFIISSFNHHSILYFIQKSLENLCNLHKDYSSNCTNGNRFQLVISTISTRVAGSLNHLCKSAYR